MNKEEYTIMYEMEEGHWWFVGMRRFYFTLLDKFYKNEDKLSILDAGCGTGIMLECFKRYGSPVGLDISNDALHFCRIRGHRKILRASIIDPPFADNSFDLVSAIGVLCQLKAKDDLIALRGFHRILKGGDRIILQVPAYDFLKCQHDKATHLKHRYTKGELKMKMEHAGFIIDRITYINTILFPLIALSRIVKKAIGPKDSFRSDLRPMPAFLNNILTFVLMIEARLAKSIDFPFGLSILCIAHK